MLSRLPPRAAACNAQPRYPRPAGLADPALVQELVTARRKDDPLAVLSSRELEVLALMAEGRSNIGIAPLRWVRLQLAGGPRFLLAGW